MLQMRILALLLHFPSRYFSLAFNCQELSCAQKGTFAAYCRPLFNAFIKAARPRIFVADHHLCVSMHCSLVHVRHMSSTMISRWGRDAVRAVAANVWALAPSASNYHSGLLSYMRAWASCNINVAWTR